MEALHREALIFKLLSNRRRLRLLEVLLQLQPLTLTELSRKSSLPVQEVHRTLSMMRELGVVARVSNKRYHLTARGLIITDIVKEMTKILKLGNYLTAHSFEEGIPLKFIRGLGLSEHISVIENPNQIMTYFKEIMLGKRGAFKIMFPNILEFLKRVLKEEISKVEGLLIETRTLQEESTIYESQVKLEIKFRPNTLTRLAMNDETALLFLPTINNEPDINASLLIKGECGIKLCNMLFQWFWETSNQLS